MGYIQCPAFMKSLRPKLILYAAAAGLVAMAIGCSQGPISHEEAEELRGEIKEMREQLRMVQSDLAGIIKSTEEDGLKEQVQDMSNKLDSMISSLSDVEEELKPVEPASQAPGKTPRQPAGGGGF